MLHHLLFPGLFAATLTLLSPPVGLAAEEGDKASPPDVRKLLGKYCVTCHGDRKPSGGLNLTAVPNEQAAKVWKQVWDRLKSRQMPPSDRPQPVAQDLVRVMSWIEETYAKNSVDGHHDPGSLRPRRLNAREHRNSFRDLAVFKDSPLPRRTAYTSKPNGTVNLYQAIIPPPEHPCAFVARILPPDTNEGGFDTIGDNLSVPPFLVERYLRTGKVLLDDMFTYNAKLGQNDRWALYQGLQKLQTDPLPKGATQRQVVAAFLREFAARAFRQPVTLDEMEKYVKLFDQSKGKDDFDTSIRLPLQAILASPRFTLLWGDTPREAPNGKVSPVRPLDDYEMAARLSCFLWSSLPDRELFQAAQQGRLRDPAMLEQQVRRMLNDRRVTTGLMEGFIWQWLQLDRLDRSAPDSDRYPLYFQNNLGELMKHELLLFADAILVEDRSILEFVDADWGFMCHPLAQHYGIADFPGKKPPSNAEVSWYRIKFPEHTRGGVLTMGKVLTGTSQPTRTSPVRRGKWVLETFFNTPPPPPPPDVDNILKEEKDQGKLTVPQRMALHRASPACASCHQMIDPLGAAFETFDPVGKWRDRDQDQVIDPRGCLANGRDFNGILEFKAQLLAQKESVVRAFTEHMLTYALGRKLELYDAATVREITRAVVKDDCKLSRVVVEVAKCYPFRHRRVKESADQ